MNDDTLYIGRYEVLQVLGRGGMGVVYKALDPGIQRIVALKTVRLGMFDEDEEAHLLDRFRQEAQAVGRLTHPNIVQVFEYNEDEGKPFIAMEFVEGRELGELMAEGPGIDLATTIDILDQMLSALGYVHQHGIVHRDLKPPNVLVLEDSTIKIMDFGIAKLESSQLTKTGAVMGTPSYMSPEQFTGHAVDARSDLFSAGVILYELLTGEKPFPGKTMPAIMSRVVRAEFELPSVINPTLSSSWDQLVARALARQPDERFQSADDFAEAIHLAADGLFEDGILEDDGATMLTGGSDGRTVMRPRAGSASGPGVGRGSARPTAGRSAATRAGTVSGRNTRRPRARTADTTRIELPEEAVQSSERVQRGRTTQAPPKNRSPLWAAIAVFVLLAGGGTAGWQLGLIPGLGSPTGEGAVEQPGIGGSEPGAAGNTTRTDPPASGKVPSGDNPGNTGTNLQAGRIDLETSQLEGSYYGLIDAKSTPDAANVLIDGVDFGITPLRMDVPPGVYVLRVEKEGFEAQETTLNMDSGTQVSVSARLSPQ